MRFVLWFTVAVCGCGYGPARDVTGRPTSFVVVAGRSDVVDAAVLSDTVLGAREALADEAALANGGAPRLVVDVTRVDDAAAGIVDRGGVPLARGTRIVLTGRAHAEDGAVDTGEVTVSFEATSEADAGKDAIRHDDALRAAARRLGRRLGERALGLPAPRTEAR